MNTNIHNIKMQGEATARRGALTIPNTLFVYYRADMVILRRHLRLYSIYYDITTAL